MVNTFSTGNHPVEALLPMLHLKNAGFEFEIATPTGKPVVFEMWAFPKKDEHVKSIFNESKSQALISPLKLSEFIQSSFRSFRFLFCCLRSWWPWSNDWHS